MSRMTPRPTPDQLDVVRGLILDRETAAAVHRLRDAGIPSLLLKGPTIATWLYDDGEVRSYRDIDLLVPPWQFEAAKQALAELGYVHHLDGADPAEFGPLEQELVGPADACIDLHHGLLGTAGAAERCWRALYAHRVPFGLGAGAEVDALDIPARAMHLVLHAAQGGPSDEKAMADLERGLDRVGREQWLEAARLAGELAATEAFAAGLRLLEAGRLLAEELSLPHEMTTEVALRVNSAPRHALFFERLAGVKGARGKTAVVVRKLFPTSVLLRANSRLARRGRAGFLLVRVLHPFAVVVRAVPAVRAWRRARRAAVKGSRPASRHRRRLAR